jgi:hypothetical protein
MRFVEVGRGCSSYGTAVVIGDGRCLRGTSEGGREVKPFGVVGTKKKRQPTNLSITPLSSKKLYN